ncbi:MAG: polysaccharide biosynthesis tyrosine autokinase [Myxococcales bacterium]|nr:polysaccharide biosynthesis tyrosine autokinase [Myxococcales bacterium]
MTTDRPLLQGPAPAADEALQVEALVRRALEILSLRRWWFLFTAAAVMIAAIVVVRHQKPVYRATGTVYIDSSPPRVLSDVSEVVNLGSGGGGYGANRSYYQAQAQILVSRDLASIVVNRLGLARDERFLGIADVDKPLTRAEKERIIANADPVGMLAGRVIAELPDEQMVGKVSFEDSDPEFAKDVVNAVMAAYKDRNIDQKRRVVRDAYADLRAIHRDLAEKRQKSRQALFKFEKENDLSDNRRLAVNDQILALNRTVREVHATRLRTQQDVAQLKRVRHSRDIFSASAPGVMRDGLVGSLKQTYLELEMKRRELGATYLEKHPKVQSVTHQMQELVALASKHVRALYDAALQTHQAAVAEEADLLVQLKASQQEDADIRLTRIAHEQLIAKADEDKMFYEKVARRLAETDLTKEVGVNNVNVLDLAVTPTVPVRPNVRLSLLLAVLLAVLIGSAVTVVVDMLDNTIKDRADVENFLKVPYLGAIPTFLPASEADGSPVPEGKGDLYTYYRPNSRVAEASRSVRTNLLFMRPDKPLRTLLITSANPREGKTSTSTTIGIALTSSSGKCVLVDTDLRKPRMHKIFGVSNEVGLTSFILGHQNIGDLVQRTEVPGLDVLPCGPLPPNPAEVLHTDRFKELLRQLQERYETVVFDSPPVEIVSDALVIASLVDGVVVVVHSEKTKREEVDQAIHSLRSVNATILGIVLSRTATRGPGYGYYYGKGYRRGKQYRYRYAADPDKERQEAARRRTEADEHGEVRRSSDSDGS